MWIDERANEVKRVGMSFVCNDDDGNRPQYKSFILSLVYFEFHILGHFRLMSVTHFLFSGLPPSNLNTYLLYKASDFLKKPIWDECSIRHVQSNCSYLFVGLSCLTPGVIRGYKQQFSNFPNYFLVLDPHQVLPQVPILQSQISEITEDIT